MNYTIEVTYTTGNSFNSEEVTDNINLAWNDLELAKQCLKHIKEHYDLYCEFNQSGWSRDRKNDEILKDADSRIWARGESDPYYLSDLYAECDDGDWRQVSTNMWCGYFETLHSAEIVTIGESDMKVVF